MDVYSRDQYTLPFGGSRAAGYDKGYKISAGGHGDNADACFASACRDYLKERSQTKPEGTDAASGTPKAAEEESASRMSLLEQMQEHMALMREKIKNGTIQPTFQTGSQSFTKEEWEKLLEKFDEAEETLRAEIETEIEAAKETGATAAVDGMEFITEETTRCTYPSVNPDEKRCYITCYTREGISCRESIYDGTSWTASDFWSISFTEEGQYEKVMEFLQRFPSDGNLRFAAHENFWQDFLAGGLDEDAFVAFFETTKDGVPDYSITEGDSTYIDKDKAKWAKYMNPFGARFYTEEEIMEITNGYYAYTSNHYNTAAVVEEERRTCTDFGQMTLKEGQSESGILGIGLLRVPGTDIHYGMSACYAEDSTEADPVIRVKVQTVSGSQDYDIHVKDVNPADATEIEMFALCNYADDKGKGTGNTFGSWQTLNFYRNNAIQNGAFEESNTTEAFRTLRLDWTKMVQTMVESYWEAGLYVQALQGQSLLSAFQTFTD